MRRNIAVNIAPGVYLAVARVKNQQRFRHAPVKSVKDLHHSLTMQRQRYLGSHLEAAKLVRCNADAEALAEHLGRVTTAFLRQENAKHKSNHVDDDWCRGFFYYNLQLLVQPKIHGCVDDLIKLAQSYEISNNIIHIVWTENLPAPLAEEAGRWCMEHDAAPTFLDKCVTAAVAVLLGVMPEPNWEEE